MLANDSLAALRTKYQTTDLNIRREYLQHLFLSYFYQQPAAQQIYFKGGTALRIVYNSPRFSEDLDFSSTLHDVEAIEVAVLATTVAIEREAILVTIAESKKTSGGYLAIIDFGFGHKPGGPKLQLRIEASFREKRLQAETHTIFSDFGGPYLLIALAQDQLVTGKLAALLDRQKPRDFYDLYFMLRKGLIPVAQKPLLRQVVPIVEQTTINFTRELKLFLPHNQWAIIKDFKPTLLRTIANSR